MKLKYRYLMVYYNSDEYMMHHKEFLSWEEWNDFKASNIEKIDWLTEELDYDRDYAEEVLAFHSNWYYFSLEDPYSEGEFSPKIINDRLGKI